MELYYGVIFIKKIPGMPGTSPGIPGNLQARPWDPQGSQAPPGRPFDPLGTPLGPMGTPGTPHSPQKLSYLNKLTAAEALHCCVRACSLGPIA